MKALLQAGRNGRVPASPEKRFLITKIMVWTAALCLLSLSGCGDGNGGSGDGDGNGGGAPDSAFSMIVPYVNEGDIAPIKEAYNSGEDAPWGFAHSGIDFAAAGAAADFQTVCAGTIGSVEAESNDQSGNWQIRVTLRYNDRIRIDYCFEPMSGSNEERDAQLAAIDVTAGQTVAAGQRIGALIGQRESSHVDFGLLVGGERVSPEPYFTDEARQSILRRLHAQWPDASMTY